MMAKLNSESSGDSGGGKCSGSDECDSVSDFDLVVKAQSGDYQAFDQIVTRHRGKQYAMIYNMVKNDADAWDLTQDAFIKAWKALPKFENRSKFSTWMFRISHNVVYDWTRKKKIVGEGEFNDEILSESRLDPSSHTTPSHLGRPDKELERAELGKILELALSKVSDKHREIILLREVQGMDYKEIATVLECSMGTVMSRLFNAKKKLQHILKNYETI